jgi:hypothetical protein
MRLRSVRHDDIPIAHCCRWRWRWRCCLCRWFVPRISGIEQIKHFLVKRLFLFFLVTLCVFVLFLSLGVGIGIGISF